MFSLGLINSILTYIEIRCGRIYYPESCRFGKLPEVASITVPRPSPATPCTLAHCYRHHSRTLPAMSYRPHPFGLEHSTGAVDSSYLIFAASSFKVGIIPCFSFFFTIPPRVLLVFQASPSDPFLFFLCW